VVSLLGAVGLIVAGRNHPRTARALGANSKTAADGDAA
jgi:hypothetical protein